MYRELSKPFEFRLATLMQEQLQGSLHDVFLDFEMTWHLSVSVHDP
jgi:hypothetical protein